MLLLPNLFRNVMPNKDTSCNHTLGTSGIYTVHVLLSYVLLRITMLSRLPTSRVFVSPTRHYLPSVRTMATVASSPSHEERTAQEPRAPRLEPVTLTKIDHVNDTIRLLRLSAMNPHHVLKVCCITCTVSKPLINKIFFFHRSGYQKKKKEKRRKKKKKITRL
jgi:hypothetical protein